jgi:hypothetical protein
LIVSFWAWYGFRASAGADAASRAEADAGSGAPAGPARNVKTVQKRPVTSTDSAVFVIRPPGEIST